MEYGMSFSEVEKLKEDGVLFRGGKVLCLVCYQEGITDDRAYFYVIHTSHVKHHEEMWEDYDAPKEAYMDLYELPDRSWVKGSDYTPGKRKKAHRQYETFRDADKVFAAIKEEGIGSWSQKKLVTTALKLENSADMYRQLAEDSRSAGEQKRAMKAMKEASLCLDKMGRIIKALSPARSKIDGSPARYNISKSATEQLEGLIGKFDGLDKNEIKGGNKEIEEAFNG